MKQESPWHLERSVGCLDAGPLRLRVDLADTQSGAVGIVLGGSQIHGQLWGWGPVDTQPLRLVEAFVRGDDLIAEYAPREDFPFHSQAYWRCERETNDTAASLSLVLSVHTHKLDTHPVFVVRSSLPSAVAEVIGSGGAGHDALLCARYDDLKNQWSAVETIQQGDFIGPNGLGCEDQVVQWRLFDHFLEKGVIRRAKLSIGLANEQWDREHVIAVAQSLRSAKAPLTA